MSEEIKKRVLRVLINSGVLFVTVTVSGVSMPEILALFSLLPSEGISLGTFFMLLLITISVFFALRILLDIVKLADLASGILVKNVPGLNSRKKVSIIRALKEIIFVLILVLMSTMVSPFLLLIPSVGTWLSIGVSLVILATSLILIYDAGKTLYTIFETGIQLFIDKLSRSEETQTTL